MSASNIDLRALSKAIKAKQGSDGMRKASSKLGFSASTFSRLTQGKPPDLGTYVRLCGWLGVPLEHFVIDPWEVRVRKNLAAAGCDDVESCAGACLAKEAPNA